MTNETNVQKLARLYKEEGFTKEQVATELFADGLDYVTVVKVSLAMDYYKA